MHLISKSMKIEEIIMGFPQKAIKLRRAMRNVLSCKGDLPNEHLDALLMNQGKDAIEIDLFVNRLNEVLQEQTDPNSISITEKAAAKLKEYLAKEGKAGWSLRIADKEAGCGTGYEYVFDVVENPVADDALFCSCGVNIYAPNATLKRFIGSCVDFEESPIDDDDQHFTGLFKLGFTISNPNIKTTCACGCSGTYKDESQ